MSVRTLAPARLRVVLGFGALLAVSACSEPARSAPTRSDRFWQPWTWTPPRPPFGVHVRRELATLRLPWAGRAGPVGYAGRPVNLDIGGSLSFEGKRWSLDSGARAASLESLGRDMGKLTRAPSAHGHEIPLRADYLTHWGSLSLVLSAVLDPPPMRVVAIRFAVASTVDRGWTEAEIVALRFGARSTREVASSVAIDMAPASGGRGAAPTLRFGERVLTFPGGDPYLDASAVEHANANWQVFLDDLRVARSAGVRGVDLTVSDEVPWAHVAMVLGLLIKADVADVSIGAESFQLFTGGTAPRDRYVECQALSDWSPMYALSLGVAGALAAFLLGVPTSHRGRRAA